MYRAACPNCGAPVTFKSSVSTYAVCEYCSSTVVRKDDQLELMGKMAQLLDDASPVQIGASGSFLQQSFQVVGRVQFSYEDGSWNEWHVLFDNGRSGWLSELNGRSTMVIEREGAGASLPRFMELRPGQQITIEGNRYEVAYLTQAQLVGGQGELPFKIAPGTKVPVVDLRGVGHNVFATLEYPNAVEEADAGAPRVFIGRDVPFAELKMSGLRDVRIKEIGKGGTRTVDCPNCGAGITIQRADTKSITCSNCHSTVGVEQGGVALLAKYSGAEVIEPPLPIGQKGTLDGRKLQIVGFLQRYVVEDGERYFWDEYLALEETTGQYIWLTCGEDGWKFGELTGTTPEQRPGGAVIYEGKAYNLVENGTAITDYVLGEFNWRVKQGDKAWYQTFRTGDIDISMERTGNEVTWTKLTKTTGAALSKAFGVDVPEAGGSHGTAAFGAVPPGSGASAGIGCGMIILIAIVVLIIIILLSLRRDCDPRYENCSSSSGSSYSRGSSGGFGGGHK